MFAQLRVTVFCEKVDDFEDVIDKLIDLQDKMKVVNPGQPNQECSVIDSLICHHDTDPAEPCELLYHWDNCPDQSPT